ncbi:hypothetical protein Taro_044277 [Colocasia esculenta]|uniref:Uncharacterized protein n=1 Tax=Colocasia esculenta TaxID=4460 RepID=A0A843WNA7_COLES|nr:hypothetical protein [Colocasia esculenta]
MGDNQKLAHFMLIVEGPLSFWGWMVEGLERAGVVAWGCGLCQGRFPATVAAVVVAVADTVVGRAGTVVAVVDVVVVIAAAAVASAVVVVASDPVGLLMGKAILRWRDLRVLALVLGRVLTLRRLLFVAVPWLLRLLGIWRSAYRALGVTDCTNFLIGLDPLRNWALRLLGITDFWGLKHVVFR